MERGDQADDGKRAGSDVQAGSVARLGVVMSPRKAGRPRNVDRISARPGTTCGRRAVRCR